jgi:NitT/TauT family transport system permease protein
MSVADRVPAAGPTLPVAALGLGLAVWWAVTTLTAVPSFLLPSPGAVAGRLVTTPGLYAASAAATLAKVLAGGAVGVAGGASLAVALTRSRWLRRGLFPYVVAARVLPKVAVAPLLLLYVGLGYGTAVVFVALVTFFPMVVNTMAGLGQVPDRQRDLLCSVEADRVRAFLAVELPYALPDAFAGLKQSVTLAVVGAVVAEWVVATDGLGALVLVGSETVQVDVMLASLAVLVAIGLGLYGAVVVCQRVLARRVPLD